MATSRIYLRHPAAADQREFLARVQASRKLHGAWVAAPDTPAKYRMFLRRCADPASCTWFVCRKDTNEIAGLVNVSNIVRGLFQSAYLGYYAFAGFEGQGLMKEGLRAVVRDAFTRMKLHRLEANIQPGNAASIALARGCGFALEGYSPRYLKIAGRWRDHERWAILAS
ncbi:GNAT family N-acetyltransferase [Ramlibacter albus]|uniref:GNAT family N-acetyltransferase n=1 Tax=Ramlibacter albus TaxID=2079448 RepID=A0A923S2K8_9BURK|nr:GNAT family N-acetyltransferase [Ramlibacter albus]MBC5765456.1 GNAT family N-acetyltransferase [Ramlibacter albus]